MKQLIFSFIIFAGSMLAFSTSVKAQTPLQFNDHIISITDSLFARGQAWGAKFNDAYKSKDFASLIPYRQNIERFVDARISEVKNMKDVKDSKDLRLAMLSFLNYEKNIIMSGFKEIESLPSNATNAEVNKAYENLKKQSEGENAELNKVSIAQKAYAKANGFRIESKDGEE